MSQLREIDQAYRNVASRRVVSKAEELIQWAKDVTSLAHFEALRAEQAQRLASLDSTLNRVRALRRREAGWNGYDALPPDPKAIVYADSWIREMYRDALSTGQPWVEPHVTSSAEGEVVFEWWNGRKKLTVYLSGEEASYVKVWGPDIVADMEEGDAAPATPRKQLWTWLTS
jgi:hypothetical protein